MTGPAWRRSWEQRDFCLPWVRTERCRAGSSVRLIRSAEFLKKQCSADRGNCTDRVAGDELSTRYRAIELAYEGLKSVAAHPSLRFWLHRVLLPVVESWPNRTMGGDCAGSSGDRFVAGPPKAAHKSFIVESGVWNGISQGGHLGTVRCNACGRDYDRPLAIWSSRRTPNIASGGVKAFSDPSVLLRFLESCGVS
jgi:hypothetical protein